MSNNKNEIVSSDQRSALQKGAVILACEVSGSTGERTIPDSSGYFQGDVLKNENIKKSAIRWLPRECIRFRNRINGQAQQLLSETGVSYYGGATLLPIKELARVEQELEALQLEFDAEVSRLENMLDSQVEDHKAKNPDIAHLVDRFRQSGKEFASKFSFRLMPPTNLDFVNGNASDGVVKDMTNQLFEEVAKEAAQLFKRTWSVAEKATAKTLVPVENLRRKLNNLSFMDDAIEPIAEAFQDALNEFPKAFPVTGEPVQKMAKFIAAASNPDTLRNFGQEAEEELDETEADGTQDDANTADAVSTQPEPVVEDSQAEAADTVDATLEPAAAVPAETKKTKTKEAKAVPAAKAEPESEAVVAKPDLSDDSDGFGWGGF